MGSNNSKYIFSDNILSLIFGHGYTTSAYLMQHISGAFRSVESLVLQLLYETGIFGLIIFLWLSLKNNISYLVHGKYRFAILFTYIQLFLFLPIYSTMQLTFLLIGVCSGITIKGNFIKK